MAVVVGDPPMRYWINELNTYAGDEMLTNRSFGVVLLFNKKSGENVILRLPFERLMSSLNERRLSNSRNSD